MTTLDVITDLFCRIDDEMRAFRTPPQAHLWPSEVVALGVLHALKGVGNRAFYRWLTRAYHARFPRLPERTRRFRSLATHRRWTLRFLGPTNSTGRDRELWHRADPSPSGRAQPSANRS